MPTVKNPLKDGNEHQMNDPAQTAEISPTINTPAQDVIVSPRVNNTEQDEIISETINNPARLNFKQNKQVAGAQMPTVKNPLKDGNEHPMNDPAQTAEISPTINSTAQDVIVSPRVNNTEQDEIISETINNPARLNFKQNKQVAGAQMPTVKNPLKDGNEHPMN